MGWQYCMLPFIYHSILNWNIPGRKLSFFFAVKLDASATVKMGRDIGEKRVKYKWKRDEKMRLSLLMFWFDSIPFVSAKCRHMFRMLRTAMDFLFWLHFKRYSKMYSIWLWCADTMRVLHFAFFCVCVYVLDFIPCFVIVWAQWTKW